MLISWFTYQLLPICRGWEDIVWAFYNARIHQAEAQASTNEMDDNTPQILLVKEEYNEANKKKDDLQ